jgi:hypothetical protein
LDSALCQLEKVSEYRFVYEDKISTDAIKIYQEFEGKTTPQILDVLLSKSGYDYVCFSSNIIVIYKKTMELPKENTSSPVTGTVIDENEKPVLAASVYVSEDNGTIIDRNSKYLRTLTKEDGSFVFQAVPSNAYVIILCINYLPRVVPVKNSKIIKLELDSVLLNQKIRIGTADL